MTSKHEAASPITFIAAERGRLVLKTDPVGDRVFRCASALEVAAVLRAHGAEERVLMSSSIDFCHEDGGFKAPGAAMAMWEEGLRLAAQPAGQGESAPVQPTSQSAASMRTAAAALLAKASDLDGLTLYTISHDHRHGTDMHYGWFAKPPTQQEMQQVIEAVSSFDPDESLQAIPFDLRVLANVEGDGAAEQADGTLRAEQPSSRQRG